MALGAYSIVRYSNNLSDQRINLGVVAWHPIDGFQWRFTPSVDRVQAIDPRVNIKPLREQLNAIENELERVPARRGKLTELATWFQHGLEVTRPYPARMHSLLESVEHFYELLVCPVEEIRRASSQRIFEKALVRTLEIAVQRIDPSGVCERKGSHRVNGVSVDVGIFTAVKRRRLLWRALSLQSATRSDDQITKAKATALDVETVRAISEYRKLPQLVVVLEPKPRTAGGFAESIAWLKRAADDVMVVKRDEGLAVALSKGLNRPG